MKLPDGYELEAILPGRWWHRDISFTGEFKLIDNGKMFLNTVFKLSKLEPIKVPKYFYLFGFHIPYKSTEYKERFNYETHWISDENFRIVYEGNCSKETL